MKYPVAARALLRDSILDAVYEELLTKPWADVTLARVADGAGISRQTIYNEFGSRDELAQAFVMREGDRFLTAVEAAIAANPGSPERALSAALEVFLDGAAGNPLIRAVLAGEGGADLLPLVTTQGQPLVERAVERLSEAICKGWPEVPRKDADLLAETLVRLAISLATLPDGPAGLTPQAITRVLGPFLDEMIAAGAGRSAA